MNQNWPQRRPWDVGQDERGSSESHASESHYPESLDHESHDYVQPRVEMVMH